MFWDILPKQLLRQSRGNRTPDNLVPNQALYRAELYSEIPSVWANSGWRC